MRTIGIMAAIAIAFIVFTSPEREHASAKPPHDAHVYEQTESQAASQELTEAVDALRRSVERHTLELDDRVAEAVETRFTSLEHSVVEVDDSRLEALEERVAAIEQTVASYPAKQTTAATSSGSSGGSSGGTFYAPTVTRVETSVYKPRWQNYDGLSFEEHARVMHGIDTTGMSDSQIAMLRDADHDTFGGGHPPAMRARSRSVSFTATGDCPGGICPMPSVSRSRTVESRGGLLGFGILGRRR